MGDAGSAVRALTLQGLKAPNVDYAGLFKQQLFNIADMSRDGVATQSEIEQQVISGGGTKADADALYQAIDTNGSDGANAEQFSQTLATPVDPAANNFGRQLMNLIDPNNEMTKAELDRLLVQAGNTQQQASALEKDVGLS